MEWRGPVHRGPAKRREGHDVEGLEQSTDVSATVHSADGSEEEGEVEDDAAAAASAAGGLGDHGA